MIDIRNYSGSIDAQFLSLPKQTLTVKFSIKSYHGLRNRETNIGGLILSQPLQKVISGYITGRGKVVKPAEGGKFCLDSIFEIFIYTVGSFKCDCYFFPSGLGLDGQLNLGEKSTRLSLKYEGIKTHPY